MTMTIDDLFKQRKKRRYSLIRIRRNETVEECECPKCKQRETVDKVRANKWVCRNCGYYLSMAPMERIQMVCDEGSFREMNGDFTSEDPLHFPDYGKKLTALHNATGQTDAFVSGVCRIAGIKVALGVLDSRFLMGSMGTVVGEKILRLTEYAGRKKLPLIIFSASGGARMQEGLFSLMQMAKTAAAVDRFKQNGGLFLSFLTNPTTGGVSASFASQPLTALAGNITAYNGKDYEADKNGVFNIYAQQYSGKNALNQFQKFQLDAGKTANLYFHTAKDNIEAQNLLNFVDTRIDINGTLNAIRNKQIGGNLFFLSPGGMAVGKGGVINTGALYVMAAWMKVVWG